MIQFEVPSCMSSLCWRHLAPSLHRKSWSHNTVGFVYCKSCSPCINSSPKLHGIEAIDHRTPNRMWHREAWWEAWTNDGCPWKRYLQATVEYNCCYEKELQSWENLCSIDPLYYKQLSAAWRAFCRERLQKLRDGATNEQIPDDSNKEHVYPPS